MGFRRLVYAVAAVLSAGGSFAAVHAMETAATSATVASAPVSLATTPNIANHDHLLIAVTPAPTPAPTPVPTPVPVVQQAASAPVPVAAPVVRAPAPVAPVTPAVLRNLLTSGDGTLNTAVGVYSDCSGRTPLTRAEAAIDTCIPGPMYFVGHNVGVFTPLMHVDVGALITYHDGAGAAHLWRVVSVRGNWRSADGVPPPTDAGVVAQFQTCVVPDGSVDRILDVALV
jgi:hypothetical protein